MLYVYDVDRKAVIESFQDDEIEAAKDHVRQETVRRWDTLNDFTLQSHLRLTRFPCGSLASDNLHEVTLMDALKIRDPVLFQILCRFLTQSKRWTVLENQAALRTRET